MVNKKSEVTYTESAQALDGILERFKSSTLTLEESLALFEQGITHLNVCKKHLGEVKGRIEILTAEGLQAFEEESV